MIQVIRRQKNKILMHSIESEIRYGAQLSSMIH